MIESAEGGVCYEVLEASTLSKRIWLLEDHNSGKLGEVSANYLVQSFSNDSLTGYYKCSQTFTSSLSFKKYHYWDKNREYILESCNDHFVVTVNGNKMGCFECQDFNFVSEHNNFGILSFIIQRYLSLKRSISELSILSFGSTVVTTVPIKKITKYKLDISEIHVELTEDGYIDSANYGKNLEIRKAYINPPENLEFWSDSLRSKSDKNFYSVKSAEIKLSTPSIPISATVSDPRAMGCDRDVFAIFIGGTGKHNRNGQTLTGLDVGYGRFLDGLASHGIGNIRYDRYASLSSYSFLSHDEILQQADIVIDYITKNNPSKIVIIGHSYGGIVAAQLFVKHKNMASLVLISTPSGTIADSIKWQRKQALKRIQDKNLRNMYKRATNAYLDKSTNSSEGNSDLSLELTNEFIRSVGDANILDILEFDLRPILIVHGEDDLQVDAQESKKIADHLAGLGNKYELKLVPGLGHLLKFGEKLDVITAKNIEFDKQIADFIHSFIE